MSFFIGRKAELERLRALPSHKPNLVVLRGRRRIGKSRLAAEFAAYKIFIPFSGMAPLKDTSAQDQRDEFARQFYSHFKIQPLAFHDWSEAFLHLTAHLTQEPTVILLDEISWMSDKDPSFISKFKNWWDMQLQQFPKLTVILCGSVSTWIEANIVNNTALFGRVSLFLTLDELSIQESYEFLQHLHFKGSHQDVFKILSVVGGVPWYLEQILPHQLADANIHRLCFVKDGLFTHEFDRIFTDLFDARGAIYKRIVHQLKGGAKTLAELRELLNYKSGGTLTQYMKDLIVAGFVTIHGTWSFKSKKAGKQSLYRLSDSYLRFYLKYIEPNLIKIQNNTLAQQSMAELAGWRAMMGFQVENLILKNRPQLIQSLGISPGDIVADNPYIQKPTLQHRGCQIDYLIQTRANNLIVCEFKFHNTTIGYDVVDEVKQKIKRLAVPRGFGVASALVHLGDLSEDVIDSQYFYRIIDLADWLEGSKA